MEAKKCIAMILAGDRRKSLGALTQHYSKPAIYFGGKHRIIDFALSNCKNSEIETVAVLSQYSTTDLNEYIKSAYMAESEDSGVHLLTSKNESGAYKGTADAVYRSFSFINHFAPEHVLILTSDHVYKMDYNKLIAFHEKKGADVTVASISVPLEEASRFGVINAGSDGRVYDFEEKPMIPKSNLASMGVYVFKLGALKEYLRKDSMRKNSSHDFGKDILPEIVPSGGELYTYQFNGYWSDIGTVGKLWESSMDQLDDPSLQLPDNEWSVGNPGGEKRTICFSGKAVISQSILPSRFSIYGYVRHSILGDLVTVGHGTEIINSVIMPNVYIGNNVRIFNAIVGNHTVIRDGTIIGEGYGSDFFVDRQICAGEVSLVSPWLDVNEGMVIKRNSHVTKDRLAAYYFARNLPEFSSETANCAVV